MRVALAQQPGAAAPVGPVPVVLPARPASAVAPVTPGGPGAPPAIPPRGVSPAPGVAVAGASPRVPNPAQSPAVAASPPAAAPVASPAAPSHTEAELVKFRKELKTGDLVDFESHLHRRAGTNAGFWFLGEVSRIEKSWLKADEVYIANHTYQESELISRDSNRIWPPMTKTETQAASIAAEKAQKAADVSAAQAAHAAAMAARTPNASRPASAAVGGGAPGGAGNNLPPIQGRPGNVAGSAAGAIPGNFAAAQPGAAPVASVEGAPGGAATPAASPAPAASPPPLVQHFGFKLAVGDNLDCLDTEKKWRLAEVISKDQTHLLIHYTDWSSKC
jgi:hypothetical protein